MKTVEEILSEHKEAHQLIDILGEIQDNYGYVSREHMAMIEQVLGIPLVDICGVATFYASFKLTPSGRHLIRVCKGTACHVKKAGQIQARIEEMLDIRNRETSADGKFTLECVNCIGACAKAPNIMIDDQVYGELTPEKAEKIIKEYRD